MAEDRTLELHTNASQGALVYLRLARDSLASVTDIGIGTRVAGAKAQLDELMTVVENIHTVRARAWRHRQSLETKDASQGT